MIPYSLLTFAKGGGVNDFKKVTLIDLARMGNQSLINDIFERMW